MMSDGRYDDSFQDLECALDLAGAYENHDQMVPIVRIRSESVFADRLPKRCDFRMSPSGRKCIHVDREGDTYDIGLPLEVSPRQIRIGVAKDFPGLKEA